MSPPVGLYAGRIHTGKPIELKPRQVLLFPVDKRGDKHPHYRGKSASERSGVGSICWLGVSPSRPATTNRGKETGHARG